MKRPIELTEDLSEDFIQRLTLFKKQYPKEPQILGFDNEGTRTDIKITKIKDGRVWGKEIKTYDPKDIVVKEIE